MIYQKKVLALFAISAGLVILSSCNKESLVSEPVVASVEQSPDVLRSLQKKGFFLAINEDFLSNSLRSVQVRHPQEEQVLQFFTSSEAVALVVEGGLENPFEKLMLLEGFQSLPRDVQDAISSISKDKKALEIYKEAVLYIRLKGDSNGSELRSYSQMLYCGPEHVEGCKQSLKAAGAFLLGTIKGGLGGGLTSLGGYLLSIW